MPSIKKTRSGTFQLCVKNKLLPKTFWATFDTFEQAEQYGSQLERLLGQGIGPAALLEQAPPKRTSWTNGRCIVEYIRNNPVPVSDIKLLDTIRPQLEVVSTGNLNFDWADGWIRTLKRDANLAPSTILALETAMRMRECYTLDVSQVSAAKRTIHLERSKNGDNRQVPMSSVARALLAEYITANRGAIKTRQSRLFPFWDGGTAVRELDRTSSEVSRMFSEAFEQAGVVGLHFHDLRHEATCRLYERTSLSHVLIAKITGHRDLRMLRRYASLRGSDLAGHLW